MHGFFITGTDTEIGKTHIAQGLIHLLKQQGYVTTAMKPVSAGCETTEAGLRNDDAVKLQHATGLDLDYELLNPYALEPAIAPHIAAEEAGVRINKDRIKERFDQLCTQADAIVVEGAGGWFVPLNETETMADLAQDLGLPVILVVAIRLGCLNHTLLSISAIVQSGLPIAGWIANHVNESGPYDEANIQSLCDRIEPPLLGRVPYMPGVDAEAVAAHLNLPTHGRAHRPAWSI